MWFIGDVHGRFRKYMWVIDEMPTPAGGKGLDCSLQVGDMGVGFPAKVPYHADLSAEDDIPLRDDQPLFVPHKARTVIANAPIVSSFHRFLRGNHDNPAMCREHPCFLGDCGYLGKMEMYFVSGGYSVDREGRTPGVTWWPEEELSARALRRAIEEYADVRPRIVVSHECPTAAKRFAVCHFSKIGTAGRTEKALQVMFEQHRPEVWIFGHHHLHVDVSLEGTRFIGLAELADGPVDESLFEIPGLTW